MHENRPFERSPKKVETIFRKRVYNFVNFGYNVNGEHTGCVHTTLITERMRRMSYYTVTVREINVLGTIWMPAVTAAYTYKLSPYDVENIGELNRENVEAWLNCHSGDFQSIQDFRADIGDFLSDWQSEESDILFADCMFGEAA